MDSRALTATFVILLGAAGCATAPPGVGKGETVAFVHDTAREEGAVVGLRNAAIRENAGTGGSTGAVVGAVSGLACGIGALICSPFLALVGGLGGAALGAGIGVAQALPEDVAAQLRGRIDTYVATHDVRQEVMNAILERGQGHWVPVAARDSGPVVRVRIDQVSLYSDPVGRVGLSMRVAILTRPVGGSPRDDIEKVFEYVGASSEPRLWIEDRDDFVRTSFRQGYAFVGQNVFAYLAK